MNLGGGNRVTLLQAIETLSNIMDDPLEISFTKGKRGDVPDTWASTDLARSELGWMPETPLEEGLIREFHWIKNR